jgi:2-polyprenyl-6-methoxyphenol hydroxylase-like FAD-dependent oxidoreductase
MRRVNEKDISHDEREDLVLIAGGGPVGLLCALLLGRRGLRVRLFEACASPQEDPRAATTHPATLEVLGAAGLAQDVACVGLVAPIVQFWDRPTASLIAEFDHAILTEDTAYPFVVQCEQFKTAMLVLKRLRDLPNVEILFEHEVVDVSQSEKQVVVTVRDPDGVTRHVGEYLIGADGGRSTVRKRAGISFDGFTWPERFLVLTTPFDFEAGIGCCSRSYFADPEEWCNCFKVSANGPPGLWRLVFPANPETPEEELISDQAVQARLQNFFRLSTTYDIVHRNLYVTHQRVARTFRLGRVLLAGDAAHVNNPIGGMGLNGGLQDAANLSEKLASILLDGASDRQLDLYHRQRRTVAVEFVQQQSIDNKKRLEARDPEMRARHLAELRDIGADPSRARHFLLRTSMIASQRRAAAVTLENA